MRLIVLSILVCVSNFLLAQPEIRYGDTIICKVGSINQNEKRHKFNPEAKTQNGESIFEVKYSGFTDEAKAAFDYAIGVWSSTIKTDVKIRVFANWAFLDNTSTLAFVTPTEVKNFSGASISNLWYPIALAEKIARKDINATTEADIVATFNSRREDWYFGIDGNCPADKLDLVTVILHELGHGLGISGTFRVSSSNGFYGLTDGNPKIYDEHLKNGLNEFIINYPNGTSSLANQLTGNGLVFDSPIARLLSSTTANPRIYAPSPYNPGSSISHLDQSTYSNTINSLMTPFAELGKVAHNCGPIIRGMLYDMGWLNTWLDHTQLVDQEDLTNTTFNLELTSDTVILSNSTKLIYSTDDFATIDEIVMQQTDEKSYVAQIANPANEGQVRYYFESKDVLGRTYRNPIGPSESFSFHYGVDLTKPQIVHTVPTDIIQFEQQLEIFASVTDNIGVLNVELRYRKNENEPVTIQMTKGVDNVYSTVINLENLSLSQGDQIKYTISAVDLSSNSNSASFPTNGEATINVLTFDEKILYTSNLDADLKEFFGDFNILKPVGFLNAAIHSEHPYLKGTSEGTNFSYVLLYPIVIKDKNSYLEFDEVVLVEPGEGADYLSESFGDYVIIEGSEDQGQTWVALEPGYDSRKFIEWLNYYNSDIRNGDSRAIGTVNYFKNHRIDLLDSFEQGDVINIRFRLFSNSDKLGWGWAIDNIKIQDEVLSADQFQEEIFIYPNPVIDKFRVMTEVDSRATIFNSVGQVVASELIQENGYFDISFLPEGIYFLRLSTASGASHFRLNKR